MFYELLLMETRDFEFNCKNNKKFLDYNLKIVKCSGKMKHNKFSKNRVGIIFISIVVPKGKYHLDIQAVKQKLFSLLPFAFEIVKHNTWENFSNLCKDHNNNTTLLFR